MRKSQYLKPLIHGQINLIKLLWHIFWIENCSIKFDVYSSKLIKLVLKQWPHFLESKNFLSLLEQNVRRLSIFPFTSFFEGKYGYE